VSHVDTQSLWVLLAAILVSGCEDGRLVRTEMDPASPSAPASVAFAGARVTDRFPTRGGELAVIPLEHAAVILGWQGKAFYLDPIDPAVEDATLPVADAILLTDDHYDHLDPVVVARVRRPETVVVAPGAAATRLPVDVVLGDGETRSVLGVSVTAVPAYDVTRGPVPGVRYHERGRGHGYVLDFDGFRVYVSGDTDCTPEVEALDRIDVAFLGTNVPYAMSPEEATTCAVRFHPAVLFPYAYRHADLSRLDRASLRNAGVVVRQRDFYPRAARLRREAYDGLAHGMWGLADDRLDEARKIDPAGDLDWRVVMTRRWLAEYERPWPW
jgi:L-ascorbate metabolism protein UlaG (beta-lactamase superfamily)